MTEDRYIHRCPVCGSGLLTRNAEEIYDSESESWKTWGVGVVRCLYCGVAGNIEKFRTTDD